jgi:hypothetical protein
MSPAEHRSSRSPSHVLWSCEGLHASSPHIVTGETATDVTKEQSRMRQVEIGGGMTTEEHRPARMH